MGLRSVEQNLIQPKDRLGGDMLHYVLPIEDAVDSEYIAHTKTLYQITMPGYIGLVGNMVELRKAWRECNLKGHFEGDNDFDPWPFAKAIGKPREELVFIDDKEHEVVIPVVRNTSPEGYQYIINALTGDVLAQDGDVTINIDCEKTDAYRISDPVFTFRKIRKTSK